MDERIGQARGKGHGASMLSGVHHSLAISPCSPNWKLFEPHPSGVFWRLHYTGMIDLITGYW